MDSSGLIVPLDDGNPWSSTDSSLAPLRGALMLAERMGHIKRRGDYDSDKLKELHEGMPSCQLISKLREISGARKQVYKVHLDIQKRMQDKETSDITHFDSLDEKIKMVKSLNAHIQSILDEKSQLITRLQQPFVGDFIKLEAQYHRYAAELFPLIAPLLADLNTHLENITWTKTLKISDGNLEGMLSDLNSTLASIQTSFQTLYQMRHGMGNLSQHESLKG